jgi:predicted enzyme related to lactoylglutathione lyase
MSERNDYPPGVPCWVDTLPPDPEAATRFYGNLMGWTFTGPGTMPGEPPGLYFVAQFRGRDVAGIGSRPPGNPPPPVVWNTYVCVASADDAAKKVADAGGKVLQKPLDVPPAGRVAVFADPDGAVFGAWEPGERMGAQFVNEPGGWSMSILQTRDPEGAKAFYGTVFGWTSEPMKMDGGELTLFRLPGYVGGEPQQPVPRDNVAVMVQMGRAGVPDQGPAHWAVDFRVPDADAAVDKTKKGGGKVLAPPFDILRFRQAVLADPFGAVFSVSQKLEG